MSPSLSQQENSDKDFVSPASTLSRIVVEIKIGDKIDPLIEE